MEKKRENCLFSFFLRFPREKCTALNVGGQKNGSSPFSDTDDEVDRFGLHPAIIITEKLPCVEYGGHSLW